MSRPATTPAAPVLLPKKWLLSLIAVLVFNIAAAFTLSTSNNKPTSSWPTSKNPGVTVYITPTVILAIITVASNACLAVAFSEAWTISWWRRTLTTSTISDLHKNWDVGDSSLSALLSLLKSVFRCRPTINLISLSKVLLLVASAQGPLLQRASRTVISSTPEELDAKVEINMKTGRLSPNFIGWKAKRDDPWSNYLAPRFLPAIRKYSQRDPMKINYTGCPDTCVTTIIAPGLDIKCSSYTVDFEVAYNSSKKPGNTNRLTKLFEARHDNKGYENILGFNMIHKSLPAIRDDSNGCAGKLTVTNCTAHDAVVKYDVILSNHTVTLANLTLDRNDTQFRVYGNFSDNFRYETPNLGGIAMVFDMDPVFYYDDSPPPMVPYADGQLAFQLVNSTADTYGFCNLTFRDPKMVVLENMRELMFRAALEDTVKGEEGEWQTSKGRMVGSVAVYQTDMIWGVLGVVLPSLPVIAIFFLGLGWKKLGRKLTLSPIETAKAFEAPLLVRNGAEANVKVEKILKKVGKVRVEYNVGNGKMGISDTRDCGEEGFTRD